MNLNAIWHNYFFVAAWDSGVLCWPSRGVVMPEEGEETTNVPSYVVLHTACDSADSGYEFIPLLVPFVSAGSQINMT